MSHTGCLGSEISAGVDFPLLSLNTNPSLLFVPCTTVWEGNACTESQNGLVRRALKDGFVPATQYPTLASDTSRDPAGSGKPHHSHKELFFPNIPPKPALCQSEAIPLVLALQTTCSQTPGNNICTWELQEISTLPLQKLKLASSTDVQWKAGYLHCQQFLPPLHKATCGTSVSPSKHQTKITLLANPNHLGHHASSL